MDSLRSGSVGDNEHTQLSARVAGPATLRFWWRVDSQEHGDYLTFSAVPENEARVVDGDDGRGDSGLRISGNRGWAEVVVPLPEAISYRVSWGYEKDSSGRSGADAGWIDEIRVEGAGYGEIALNEPEALGSDSVRLSFATLPCRHYQVYWRKKSTSQRWQGMISKVEPATGIESSVLERRKLFEQREYRVALLAPPSFTPLATVADAGIHRGRVARVGVRGGGERSAQLPLVLSGGRCRCADARVRFGGGNCPRFRRLALGIEDSRVEGAERGDVCPGCGERGGS